MYGSAPSPPPPGKKYEEEDDETNKLEQELRERLEGSVQVHSW